MLFPRRFAALAFLVVMTLVSVGYVHGLWTNRWAASFGEQEILEMEKLPLELGDWLGRTVEDDAKQLQGGSTNFLTRRYVKHADATVANVMLSRGRPGPMVIKHLPTECYESAGFELVGQPKLYLTRSEPPHQFRVATFKKTTNVSPVIVRVYWSWSATGQWQIPDRPRLAFARYPVLYKLYVVQNLPSEDVSFEDAPVHDLIEELTKAMRGTIFPSASR